MKPNAPRYSRNAYLLLLIDALFVTASQVFIKLGAAETAKVPSAVQWLGFTGLYSNWVWVGIGCLILSFVCWMIVLRSMPLNIAYMLSNVVHVLIPISCWLFLKEVINPTRWSGIALVTIGLMVVASPAVKLEERL
jgi:drug/metabolite transporter (DMT)-like permease